MDYITILAAAKNAKVPAEDIQVVPIDFIWEQITTLTWFQAVLAISFGVVYLMYGWRIFRVLVVISFALLGMLAGIHVGKFFNGSEIWGGVVGLLLAAFLSMPLMKWCVCILGAAAGGILTGGLWYAFELPQTYIWAGSLVGVVAGGMISFIVLKAAVMLFTSLGGSGITVVGALALLHLYETTVASPATDNIHNLVFEKDWFLPVALMVPTILGMMLQNKFIKHSHKWEF
ncbi:MAG: hypothetical protein KAR47_16960 [Planctomycetes bacterium]|nr:hypothetical protein [Planctomycetota bacterium]